MPPTTQPLSLNKAIANSDLFLNLSNESKSALAKGFRKVSASKKQVIIRQGEPGDALYLVASGVFSAFVAAKGKQKKLGEIKPGGCFGEGALVTSEPRNATVVCNQGGTLFKIQRDDFARVLRGHPEEIRAFVRLIGRRSRALHRSVFRPDPRRIRQLITAVPLFAGVGEKLIAELEPQMEWIFLPGGETLMRQGDPADGMYVVVNGSLLYEVRNHAGKIVSSGAFNRGDIIGEIALLTGEPRTATVIATLSCEIVKISTAAFESVFSRHPPSMLAITRLIASRLTNDRMGVRAHKKRRSLITLFPLQKHLLAAEIGTRLLKALKPYGRTACVELGAFKRHIGNRQYTISDLLEWLYHLEEKNEFLILCADFGDKIWTETILHHTNRILLLSDPAQAANLTPEEIRYLGDASDTYAPQRELVLLYGDGQATPENTAEGMAMRKIDAVRHIRTDGNAGFERLARFITGRSVGVALGGGGAKGLAHIGLLKAMHEEKIPIDMIGGTSAGALMAGIYAMGYDAPKMERVARTLMSEKKTLNDYTFPGVSLIRGKKFNSAIRDFVKDTMIEDLWLPFFSVATSLTKAQKTVMDRGPLWKALRASASIPGILPPFFDKGELLVDGAMLDNIPGSVMRERGADFVISVALASDTDEAADETFSGIYEDDNPGALPSAWRSFFQRIFRGKKKNAKTPGLLSLLMRATFVASDAAVTQARAESDIFIQLPVGNYGLFDWKKFDELVDIGYRYGKTHAKLWKRQLAR